MATRFGVAGRFLGVVAAVGLLSGPRTTWAAAGSDPVWTDPEDPALPADAEVQGEYAGSVEGSGPIGCQVIALGNGCFQAVFLPGGLPGEGWDGKTRIPVDGRTNGTRVAFAPCAAAKKYLAGPPDQFSAVRNNPPAGQSNTVASIEAGTMTGQTAEGRKLTLKKVARKSPTLGMAPPQGATILFDGANLDAWQGGRLDEKRKTLCTDGKDVKTRKSFNNYTMHVEFMLPFRPAARGQGRGNSGFYQVDHYEVQVLDSFGLEGLDNECGGVYRKGSPRVNMCLPPLTWQTYDIDFTNAQRDEAGKKTKGAVLTLRHNGVLILENLEVDGPTGGHRADPEGTPGPIKLQGHGNPLAYRNLWIVERP